VDEQSKHRKTRSTALSDLMTYLDEDMTSGQVARQAPIGTGFKALDETIGGGFKPGDLVILAGPPGVGKTIVALQWARNVAAGGARAIYVCYEHDEAMLMQRLLAQECGRVDPAHPIRDLPERIRQGSREGKGMRDAFAEDAVVQQALNNMEDYAARLLLVRASGAHTALENLDDLVFRYKDDELNTVLFVDYLQKVAMHPEPDNEGEKVTRLVEGLKDMALTHELPIVAISAVGLVGMDAARLRLHHLRGSSALGFESDVVVMLNEKMKAVSRVHLAYDSTAEKRFREQVIFSVEKNRNGQNLVDLEFRKDFRHFRYHEDGSLVTERLVSERLDEASV